jgi:hypothetical protein
MNRLARLATFATVLLIPLPALAAPIQAVLYKNPVCTCCEGYVAYLEQNGFAVDVKPTNDLSQIAANAGVPPDLEGCHTMTVDGYIFDGLIPVDIVDKVLKERPAITGITLAGMPTGAPGMGGGKSGPFTVYAFTKDGKAPFVYAVE